jgi:hypothetical protein
MVATAISAIQRPQEYKRTGPASATVEVYENGFFSNKRVILW